MDLPRFSFSQLTSRYKNKTNICITLYAYHLKSQYLDIILHYIKIHQNHDLLRSNVILYKGSITRCVFCVRFHVRQTVCRRGLPTNVACLCVKRFVGHKNAHLKRTV
jgi:hypothetical protein